MFNMFHVLVGLEVSVDPDPHDVVAEPPRCDLDGPVDQPRDAEQGEEEVPEPQDQEDLKPNVVEIRFDFSITQEINRFWLD